MNKWQQKEVFDTLDINDYNLSSMSNDEIMELISLVKTKEEFLSENKLVTFTPDPWVNKLNTKMLTESVASIVASNRSGKSYSVTWMLACHMTGLYPSDWEGIRYDQPIKVWLMSPTSDNFKQEGGLHEYLYGCKTKSDELLGTGWFPLDCIGDIAGNGVDFIKAAKIKHVSGGWSSVEYKSYEQGATMLQGANIDLLVIDEEPKNEKIFPEAVTRILQAPSGKGRALLCFTPTNGRTKLVADCLDGVYKGGCERITVWDCPWITTEKIEEMKRTIPEREWDLRLKGIPQLGTGAVYDFDEESIKFYPEQIQIQDHWKVAAAIDFGYNPDPCAILYGAIDTDTGVFYLFKEFYETQKTMVEIGGYIRRTAPSIPVIYPADGNTSRVGTDSAKTYVEMLEDEGVNMATRVDYGNNSREAGHMAIREAMRSGSFLVSHDCINWFKEFRLYQYDEKSSTNKCDDHAMDATRYLFQKIHDVGIYWKDVQQQGYSPFKSVPNMGFNKNY